MEKDTLQKIKVEYKTFGKDKINSNFEKRIEKIADDYGLEFTGSGFNLKTGVRDLSFKGMVEN